MKKNKLIINLAPTGMVPFKKDNPNFDAGRKENCRGGGAGNFLLTLREPPGQHGYRNQQKPCPCHQT